MKKAFIILGLIYCLLVTGCPTQTQIQKAAKAGYESSERLRTAQHVTLELWQGGVLSLESKDKFFDAAKRGFDVLEIYNNEVERQVAAVKAGTQTMDGAIAVLRNLFSTQTLATLNAVIVALNLLDPIKANRLFGIVGNLASSVFRILDILKIPRAQLAAIKS
jgi:hypothetical protein